jgi:metal-responsive CopG/Arc/MetJ family transcriptional regulator
MKTAISLPDAIFAEAERVARRLKKTRSQLYREAVTEYLARRDPDAVTEAMDRVADHVENHPEAWLSEAARRLLERSEW